MSWRTRADRAIDWLGVPLVAFIGVQWVTYVAALSTGRPPWGTGTWSHWDSGHYIAIAEVGYGGDCGEALSASCGNAGWFPGIAWMTRPFTELGADVDDTMLVLARLFTLAMLVVIWNLLLDREHSPGAYLGMAFAAFCPGAVYFHAVFPMAAAAFFACAMFAALRHGRDGWAAAAGLVGATTYPVMPLLAPLAAGWILLGRREETGHAPAWALRLRSAALVGGATTVGALLVVWKMREQTGVWDAYFVTQATYDGGTGIPFETWYERAWPAWNAAVGQVAVVALQACFVLGLVILLCVSELRHGVRALRGIRLLILGWVVVVWTMPMTATNLSTWRTDSLLVPAAVLVARLPVAVAALVVLGAIGLLGPMVVYYVSNELI